MTKSWEVTHCGPEDGCSNDPPECDCRQPTPLPEAARESTVDVSQPKPIGFVGAGHGSELQELRSITGCVSTLSPGAIAHKSET